MKQQFFDLGFEQNEDGTIRLTQNDFGEPVCIDLHPQQLAFVAQAFEKQPTKAVLPRDLVRRLDRLQHGIKDLYNYLDAVPCFPPGHGETEDVILARELLDGIDELFEVFGLVAENTGGSFRKGITAEIGYGNQEEAHATPQPTPQPAEHNGQQLGLDV